MNLVVYGTRPEEIKVYPFTKHKGFEFAEVNQSKDLHQGLIKPDYRLEEAELEQFVKKGSWGKVIVQGDTRTAFRAALYAFESKKPVVHVEAGMRTFDLTQPFPEEAYRQMIDVFAVYKFCSTPEATKNCDGIYVGQTSIDTLFSFSPNISNKGYAIVTVHRNESYELLPKFIKIIKSYAGPKRIFAHPNRVGQEIKKAFPEAEAPMKYTSFVSLLAGCDTIITDSGGLQEEGIALGKKVIVLREKSERGHGESYAPGATTKIVEYLK